MRATPSTGTSARGTLAQIVAAYGQDTDGYHRAIRAAGSEQVFWDEDLQGWVVTAFEACRRLLTESSLTKNRLQLSEFGFPPSWNDTLAAAQRVIDRQMNFDDGALGRQAHRRWASTLQSLGDAAFEESLALDAARLLDECPRDATFDLYNTVLRRFVSRAVFGLLGIAEHDRIKRYDGVYKIVDYMDGKIDGYRQLGEFVLHLLALSEFVEANSERLRARFPHEPLDESWAANFILTLVTGHESTAYTLGVALLQASTMGVAFESPQDIAALFWEALRFDAPNQLVGRVAKANVALTDRVVARQGQRVFLHLGAANRDPDQFPDPDRFDLGRPKSEVLVFGHGASRCIGSAIATMQARSFLRAIFALTPRIAVEFGNPVYAHGLGGRSFAALPTILGTGSRAAKIDSGGRTA